MVFTDWTFSGSGSAELDGATKYDGNSSCRLKLPSISGTGTLTHNTFSEPQAQIIAWIMKNEHTASYRAIPKVNLSGYGSIDVSSYLVDEVWSQFRLSFWYDVTSDTRWGRIEEWVDSAWAVQGSEINFGAGSPSAGTLSLILTTNNAPFTKYAYFDEVEVSS